MMLPQIRTLIDHQTAKQFSKVFDVESHDGTEFTKVKPQVGEISCHVNSHRVKLTLHKLKLNVWSLVEIS